MLRLKAGLCALALGAAFPALPTTSPGLTDPMFAPFKPGNFGEPVVNGKGRITQ